MGQGYNKTVDWWTLGVLLYEMLTGLPPFYDENTNEMYRKILSEPLHFSDVVPPAAKDLLTKLLNRNPEERLGANGSAEIKAHPFFHAIDWRKLLQRKYEPTFKPSVVSHASDLFFYFDLTNIFRPMLWTLPTLTPNSHLKHLKILTSKDPCYPRQCRTNSKDSATTDQLPDWAMQAVVSRIHHSLVV
jgi:serine/threonine protein kinase